MKTLVYDLEIIKGILGRNESSLPGIEYCAGWEDHANMGISVLCAYESWSQRYRVFCDDNKAQFQAAIDESDCVVGFNSLAFDNSVVEKNWGVNVPVLKSYDILVELWRASGLDATFRYPSHAGFSLDATLAANFGHGKTGHGAYAPVQWQRGEVGSVVDYCLMDVHQTKFLFDEIVKSGILFSPKDGSILTLRKPE